MLDSNPEASTAFAGNMRYLSSRPGFAGMETALVRDFPWNSLSQNTERFEGGLIVVDVGGGLGRIASQLIQHHDRLVIDRCIVQDLPRVISQAKDEAPASLFSDGRAEFCPYDFLGHVQPVEGADVYLFRTVLHDWSDESARGILRNMVPALSPGAHVIVQDFILPPPGLLSFFHEKTISFVS